MIFFGIDYSWEKYYQAIGRVMRFGQKHDVVNIYVVTSNQESHIYRRVETKGKKALEMTRALINEMNIYQEVTQSETKGFEYMQRETVTEQYTMWNGDSCERLKDIEDDSIHLSVNSPPFSDMFVYSSTPRDLGNSLDDDEFFEHYKFIIRELYRVTMSGRITAVHIADGRLLKGKDGHRGRKDLSGRVIEAYTNEGWIFWNRITIDKNPQAQAIRLKDHGLLFKTLKKDSTELSGGHPDYVLVFKKQGHNPIPVTPFQNDEVTADDWITWAHPVWYDIRESDTLNVRVARSDQDEKHMAPLQLGLINRLIRLYSNPNETVLSPFGGIGSEGYEAIQLGRKYHGIELKPEYYNTAIDNLNDAVIKSKRGMLFDLLPDTGD